MRERKLPECGEIAPAAEPCRRRGPFADSVHAQDRRRVERRGIESRGGVGFVMLAEEHRGQLGLLQTVAKCEQLGL
jgi:hypothetical protein